VRHLTSARVDDHLHELERATSPSTICGDAVSRIGPEKSAPFADRSAPSASGAEARREFRVCKRHLAE